MATDVSRFLHKPRKRYFGVRMQQGRLLLDSDFNEAAQLHEDDHARALIDAIGGQGSPDQGFSIGRPAPNGDELLRPADELPAVTVLINGTAVQVRPVTVRRGTFYVGGRRYDLEADEPFAFQRDYLQLAGAALPVIPELALSPPTDFRDFYYLHAWEQPVTNVEDDDIADPALGGVDTSVRLRRMRRVEVIGNLDAGATTCGAAWERLIQRLETENARLDRNTGEILSNGRLRLVFRQRTAILEDCRDCNPEPPARFLGVNNQTLRIMLTDPTHFVWAFDNAAPLYRVQITGLSEESPTRVRVTLLTPPSDEEHWPLAGRVVEVLPFAALLDAGQLPGPEHPHYRKIAAEIGAFTRVLEDYDPNTRSFTIDLEVGLGAIKDLIHRWDPSHPDADLLNLEADDGSDARFFYVRFWHQAARKEQVELPINRSERGQSLEGTSVVPVFTRTGRRGDFWVAALRPGSPEGVVPFDLTSRADGVPPHGPRHFVAPIALIQGGTDQSAPGEPATVHDADDCRARIRRLADPGCITWTVGDGVTSTGDFSSIQDAIDSLPKDEGGRIAVRAGTYRERIRILGRNNIVIEGCGDTTVIETPPSDPLATEAVLETDTDPNVLIQIDADVADVMSTNITLTGLRIHSVEQTGILARNTVGLNLQSLSVIAGFRNGPRFARGALASTVPLVDVRAVDNLDVGSVVLETSSRPGLRVLSSNRIRVSELTGVGAATSNISPLFPIVGFEDCNVITIQSTTLNTFGQIGILLARGLASTVELEVINRDVEISSLSVVGASHRALRSGRVTSTQSGLNIDGGERIVFEKSSIIMDDSFSEHAAAAVRATDVRIRGNRFEALSRCFDVATARSPSPSPGDCRDLRVLAWAGLQIRGGSSRVEVRENHLIGGIGHGITLGSVRWQADSTARRLEGAGRGQVTARSDGNRAATGLIARSFRDEFGTFFTAEDEPALSEIAIVENRIEQMSGNGISALSVLGMPGESLVDVQGLRIERNTIIGNLMHPAEAVLTNPDVLPFTTALRGSGVFLQVLPFGGIVLGAATAADIRGNTIMGNGTSQVLPINGIFILVGDAIVISENRIAANGGRASPSFPLRPGVRAGVAVMLAGTGQVNTELGLQDVLHAQSDVVESTFGRHIDGSALALLNNSIVQPEGRALHLVASGPVRVDGNHLASQGNHGADVPAEQFAIGDVVFIQNMGAPWEAIDNVPRPRHSPEVPSFLQYAEQSPWYFFGEGGPVLFSNNQVIHDWQVVRLPNRASRIPLSFFPVALLSLDHLSIEANQFAFRLSGIPDSVLTTSPVNGFTERVLAHALMLGATVQVSGNRFAETVRSVSLSMISLSKLMNMATFNQFTHEMFAANSRRLMVQTPPGDVNIGTLTESFPNHADNVRAEDVPSSTAGVKLTEYYTRYGNQVLLKADQFIYGDVVPRSDALRIFSLNRVAALFFELLREGDGTAAAV